MVDHLLVERKLGKITTYLRELQSVQVKSLEEFKRDVVTRRFIERQLELCVERMIDICKHLVAGLDLPEPETYAGCFDILKDAGVVPEPHAAIFKSMARFRNLLIYGYDDVDDAVTYGARPLKLLITPGNSSTPASTTTTRVRPRQPRRADRPRHAESSPSTGSISRDSNTCRDGSRNPIREIRRTRSPAVPCNGDRQ